VKILPRPEAWLNDQLKERCRKVEPATIGHYLHFGFMEPKVRSVLSDVKVVGTAFTVKTTSYDSIMVHKAVSLAEEGDVIVIDRSGDQKHACVGEIVAYAAHVKKVAAIIIDGPSTDVQAIRNIGIPVFSTGLSPITTKLVGNSGEINTSIQCGGVTVNPGDLIVADDNGVLVLGQNIEDIETALTKAEASEANEPNVKVRLDGGEPLASISRADELLRQAGLI
jgi:4-hydroxy-4-methyl-2-oxoglutarate aldolase